MDISQATQFVAENHRAVLATTRSDGRFQLSPVTAGVDGDGRVRRELAGDRGEDRQREEDPYAALCVFTDRFFGGWVQVEGEIEVVSLPDAMEGLVDTTDGSRASTPTGTTTGRRW